MLHTGEIQPFCLICPLILHTDQTNHLSYLSYCTLIRHKLFVLYVILHTDQTNFLSYLSCCTLIRHKCFVLSVILYTSQIEIFYLICQTADQIQTFCVICHTAHWSDTNILCYLSYCTLIRYVLLSVIQHTDQIQRFVLSVILYSDQIQMFYLWYCTLIRHKLVQDCVICHAAHWSD